MINLVIMAKCLGSVSTVNDDSMKGHFLEGIVALSARRSLEKEKINSLEKLAGYSEEEIMQLHGFGKNGMEKLKNHMSAHEIYFKKAN